MIINNTNPKVDEFLQHTEKWHEEFVNLRKLILDYELTEELKWGVPCYTYQEKNILLIHGFKQYCAILFIKGSLLQDPHNLLIQQTENVQAGRQLRFTNVQEINSNESIIKSFIREAIEIEKARVEVSFKKSTDYTIPLELQNQFDIVTDLETAFKALSPGRQNAYLYYFSAPKLPKTREVRVEKYVQQILDGKGM